MTGDHIAHMSCSLPCSRGLSFAIKEAHRCMVGGKHIGNLFEVEHSNDSSLRGGLCHSCDHVFIYYVSLKVSQA